MQNNLSNLSDEQLEEYALKCKLYELNNVLTEDKRISADNILAMPVKEVEANLDKLNGVEPEKEAENAELTDEQKKAINNLPGAPVSDLNPEKPKKVSKIATAAKKLWNIMTNNKAATIAACAALAGIVALAIANPSLAGALVVGGDIYKGYKGR